MGIPDWPRLRGSVTGLVTAALRRIPRPGPDYAKCGVMLADLYPAGARQADAFDTRDTDRRWLEKAQAWLDQYRDGMPARAEEELGLHLHNWLEAHVLRREAEALIRPTGSRSDTENRERGAPRK